jgi:hypothetical protein
MRQGSAERVVRRNITFPESFGPRLEALKLKRGVVSDSEILRQGLSLLEAVMDKDSIIVLRNKTTGKETEVLVP